MLSHGTKERGGAPMRNPVWYAAQRRVHCGRNSRILDERDKFGTGALARSRHRRHIYRCGAARRRPPRHRERQGADDALESCARHRRGHSRGARPCFPTARAGGDVALVSVSTTLATNAVVENRFSPVCTLLIGFDDAMVERSGLQRHGSGGLVVRVQGGHGATGEESAPLDEAAVARAVVEHEARVEAFAVAANFSVRNPAHELRARKMIRALSPKPVTCAHELSSKLDAPRRALTAALNARLTPQIRHLIEALSQVLKARVDRCAAHDRQGRRLADEGGDRARISRSRPFCRAPRRASSARASSPGSRISSSRTWAAPPPTSRWSPADGRSSAARAPWSAPGAPWSRRWMCAPAVSAATAKSASTGSIVCASVPARRCRSACWRTIFRVPCSAAGNRGTRAAAAASRRSSHSAIPIARRRRISRRSSGACGTRWIWNRARRPASCAAAPASRRCGVSRMPGLPPSHPSRRAMPCMCSIGSRAGAVEAAECGARILATEERNARAARAADSPQADLRTHLRTRGVRNGPCTARRGAGQRSRRAGARARLGRTRRPADRGQRGRPALLRAS